jgi:hypothetical protein
MIARGPHVKGNVNARGDGNQMGKAGLGQLGGGLARDKSKLVRDGVAFRTRVFFFFVIDA